MSIDRLSASSLHEGTGSTTASTHSISSSRPGSFANATEKLIKSEQPASKQEKTTVCCGHQLTGNSKTLIVSTVLFLAITCAQYFAAIIANSVALKADCVSMLVDALSYMGNLMAECTPVPRLKKKLELGMSGISFVLLLTFTTLFIIESVDNIHHKQCLCGGDDPYATHTDNCHFKPSPHEACEPDDDVNAWIVFGFALGGLLFDAVSLLAYKYWSGEGSNVNMMSALMHVMSDLARSTTTFIESIILFKYPNVDGTRVDGWSALIVCSLIAVGAFSAFTVWCKEMYKFFFVDADDQGDDAPPGYVDVHSEAAAEVEVGDGSTHYTPL